MPSNDIGGLVRHEPARELGLSVGRNDGLLSRARIAAGDAIELQCRPHPVALQQRVTGFADAGGRAYRVQIIRLAPRQVRDVVQLARRQLDDSVVKARHGDAAGLVVQARQNGGQSLDRIGDRAAVTAGMQILAGASHGDFQRANAATAGDHARQVGAPLRAVGGKHEIGGEVVLVGGDEGFQMGAGYFLFALEQEHHVDRQSAIAGEKGLRDLDRDQHRPLVVRRAAPIKAAVADFGLKRFCVPGLQRVRRLHVEMAVDEHGRLARRAAPGGGDDRMSFRRPDFGVGEAGFRQLLRHELRRPDDVALIGRVGRNAGNADEGLEIFKDRRAVGSQPGLDGVHHLPPSTDRHCPVIHDASSLVRNKAAALMSSTVPSRRIAMRSSNWACPSGP